MRYLQFLGVAEEKSPAIALPEEEENCHNAEAPVPAVTIVLKFGSNGRVDDCTGAHTWSMR